MPPGNLIGSPSSRRNVMVGGGEPVNKMQNSVENKYEYEN